MAVKEGKERRCITLPIEDWEYLDQRVKEYRGWRRYEKSNVIQKMIADDRVIRKIEGKG